MNMKIQIEPVIVVPDATPLIHLAAGNALHLLNSYGRVVIMDVVAFETTRYPDKPYAKEVASWIKHGEKKGSNQPVEVQKTEIGEAYALAVKTDPEFRLRHAGERAIRDWLADTVPTLGGASLIIYEESRVPMLLEREHIEGVILSVTTNAFLHIAEQNGLIKSSEELWKKILNTATTASPGQKLRVHLPKR